MTPNMPGLNMVAPGGSNGQAPRCEHMDTPPAGQRGAAECAECLLRGWTWTRLLACRTCGWVACSDESPGGHARQHYQETDHPVATTLEPEAAWRWCYAHGRAV